MARPRSEDKRQTILRAATQLFAEEGINAPTARIAKIAGVAEGSIFTYFATKDELLNQLYLELKTQLRASVVAPPDGASLQEKVWQAWRAYVDWGLEYPDGHRVLAKLAMSPRITEATRVETQRAFCNIVDLLAEAMSQGGIRHQSPHFVGALMAAMADTTMDFIKADPTVASSMTRDGFTAFWNAIS